MDATKEKIMAAAMELFAEKGLEGVTTRQICEAAGINGALVNYHFGKKEKLYGECVKRIFESAGGQRLADLYRSVTDARSWKAAVKLWVRSISETLHAKTGILRYAAGIYSHEIRRPSAISDYVKDNFGMPVFSGLVRLLEMAVKEREQVYFWAASIWSQLSAHAIVAPSWQEPFRPKGMDTDIWGVRFADFVCDRIFRELKYVPVR